MSNEMQQNETNEVNMRQFAHYNVEKDGTVNSFKA